MHHASDLLRTHIVSLLAELKGCSSFYENKYSKFRFDTDQDFSEAAYRQIPFLTKQEVVESQAAVPPLGGLAYLPRRSYTRLHQTSGTSSGKPLAMYDSPEGWAWMLRCWQRGFELIGLTKADRLYFAFSFGPFLGFWTAFEAGVQAGYFCLAGGGMSSLSRLKAIIDHDITTVFCTPTYAFHLGEVAQRESLDLRESSVRRLVVAGEPGGNIPEVRAALHTIWGATVIDHYGLTEVGPTAFETADAPGDLVVLSEHYLAEVINPETTEPVGPGEVGELVLSNPGRFGNVVIRYRTGDLVKLSTQTHPVGLRLHGGILGRADDMLHIRGNNVYPTAIEAIIRRYPEILEYRIIVDESGPLLDLCLELELCEPASPSVASHLQQTIQTELLFRVEVKLVPAGSLGRFEMKAKRLVKLRKKR